jgi:hypothetical protein
MASDLAYNSNTTCKILKQLFEITVKNLNMKSSYTNFNITRPKYYLIKQLSILIKITQLFYSSTKVTNLWHSVTSGTVTTDGDITRINTLHILQNNCNWTMLRVRGSPQCSMTAYLSLINWMLWSAHALTSSPMCLSACHRRRNLVRSPPRGYWIPIHGRVTCLLSCYEMSTLNNIY